MIFDIESLNTLKKHSNKLTIKKLSKVYVFDEISFLVLRKLIKIVNFDILIYFKS